MKIFYTNKTPKYIETSNQDVIDRIVKYHLVQACSSPYNRDEILVVDPKTKFVPEMLVKALHLISQNPNHWNQNDWHCGTSHCLAGFLEIIDLGYASQIDTIRMSQLNGGGTPIVAGKALGLEYGKSYIPSFLFRAGQTFEDLCQICQALVNYFDVDPKWVDNLTQAEKHFYNTNILIYQDLVTENLE